MAAVGVIFFRIEQCAVVEPNGQLLDRSIDRTNRKWTNPNQEPEWSIILMRLWTDSVPDTVKEAEQGTAAESSIVDNDNGRGGFEFMVEEQPKKPCS